MVEDYQENYGYGWVSIYRSVTKHWIWDDPVMFQRWITILLSVNHEPTKYKHYYTLVDLEAGQSVKSIRTWASLMRCSTKTAVKTFDLLEQDGMIKRETLGKGKHSTTLITVENYKQYQKERKHNGNTTETKRKHNGDTDNNDNNANNDNKVYRGFGKLSITKDEFNKLVKDGYTPSQVNSIIDSIENYSKNHKYKSLYLTAKMWLKKEPKQKQQYEPYDPQKHG